MANIKIKNPEKFCNLFIAEYLTGGLGRLQKRDAEILVLHLLIEDGRYDLPKDIFQACRDLRLTEARIRNLYQEVQLRYKQLSLEEAKEKFVEIFKKKAYKISGDRITFTVRDPMLGQFFEEWVAKADGFTDSSFNKNLVTVDKEVLSKVIGQLATKEIGEFPEEAAVLNEAKSKPGLFRLFAEEFVKSAGKESGKLTAQGAAAAIAIILGL